MPAYVRYVISQGMILFYFYFIDFFFFHTFLFFFFLLFKLTSVFFQGPIGLDGPKGEPVSARTNLSILI